MKSLEAVGIGINSYANGPLLYAVDDATYVGDSLEKANTSVGVRLVLDKEATRSRILTELRELAQRRSKHKLVYLAGHAAVMEHGVYFLPFGAADWTQWVGFKEVIDVMAAGNGDLTVVLDCCHAAGLDIETAYRFEDYEDALSAEVRGRSVSALLACNLGATAREQKRLGHGVFTYHLIQGLTGGAADGEGVVTPESLHSYIARKLAGSQKQTPVFKSSLYGRVVLCDKAPYGPSEQRLAELQGSVERLKNLVTATQTTLAELRPPFSTREDYKARGWLLASKSVEPVIETRERLIDRWAPDELGKVREWRGLSSDIDLMLNDLSSVGIDFVTEFGTVTEEIGRGGFGVVYRVGDNLAYKVLHGFDIANRSKSERFRTGYIAMNRLAHPQIVRVTKMVQSPLSFFMDYVSGVNLRAWSGTSSDPVELLRMFLSIVRVLEAAHSAGVLHRDLKPENVIVRYEGAEWVPILTDFDLAWFTNASSHTKEAFGAPFYAAPEQLTNPGGPSSHEPPVDVYGLGALGYFLFTGSDPIDKGEAKDTFQQISNGWPSVISADTMRKVLARATSRRSKDRYQTMRAMREDVMAAWQALVSASTPAAVLMVPDFFQRIATYVALDGKASESALELTSASGRNRVNVSLSGHRVQVDIEKLDNFQAVGLSHDEARTALVKRVDRLLKPPIRRVGAQTARTRLVWEECGLKDNDAQLIADSIVSVIAIHDEF